MNFNYYFHADDFGRSEEISKNILKSLTKGNLNSVSIMVNYINDKYHFKLKKLKNINKRLHLNLTEIPEKQLKKNDFLANVSFFELIFFTNFKKKKSIMKLNHKFRSIKDYINLGL